jgi:hypothetical protein
LLSGTPVFVADNVRLRNEFVADETVVSILRQLEKVASGTIHNLAVPSRPFGLLPVIPTGDRLAAGRPLRHEPVRGGKAGQRGVQNAVGQNGFHCEVWNGIAAMGDVDINNRRSW